MGHLFPSEMTHQEIRTFESSPFDRRVRHFSKIFPVDGRNVKGDVPPQAKIGLEWATDCCRLLNLQCLIQRRLA